jgi:transposase-like protein
MNIDELRAQIPDETSCREFFENLIWHNGRTCPHCDHMHSYMLSGLGCRPGLYECARCKKQFTVTTKTRMHSTKLSLWKWLWALYYILNSSKGISSIYFGRLIGVKQSTAWKMGHAIRNMMNTWVADLPQLTGVIEMDEKFFGGKQRYHFGVRHKVGKGTEKQIVLITTQRQGSVRPISVDSVKADSIIPIVDAIAEPKADLMTDKCYVFQRPGRQFASHQTVYHYAREYARGDVHINTAESFSAMLERTKNCVFNHMIPKHLDRYLT